MKGLRTLFLSLVVVLTTLPSHAALIIMEMGEVELLGENYLFSFAYDSEAVSTQQTFELLGGEITFDNEADAFGVAETLLALFPAFDWNPANDIQTTDGLRIAFGLDSGTYSYVTIREYSNEVFGPFDQSVTDNNNFSLAFFERIEEIVDVSAPGTLGLMLASLVLLVRLSKRRTV